MSMNVLTPLSSVTRMHYAAIVQGLTTVLASRGTLVTGRLAQVCLRIGTPGWRGRWRERRRVGGGGGFGGERGER